MGRKGACHMFMYKLKRDREREREEGSRKLHVC